MTSKSFLPFLNSLVNSMKTHLVSEATIICMFHDSHQLYTVVTQFCNVRQNLFREVIVAGNMSVWRGDSNMCLVNFEVFLNLRRLVLELIRLRRSPYYLIVNERAFWLQSIFRPRRYSIQQLTILKEMKHFWPLTQHSIKCYHGTQGPIGLNAYTRAKPRFSENSKLGSKFEMKKKHTIEIFFKQVSKIYRKLPATCLELQRSLYIIFCKTHNICINRRTLQQFKFSKFHEKNLKE